MKTLFVVGGFAVLAVSALPVRGGAGFATDRSVMGEGYWQLWNDKL